MIAATRRSTYDEFWPTGWLVWACVALGVFDAAMLVNLLRLVLR